MTIGDRIGDRDGVLGDGLVELLRDMAGPSSVPRPAQIGPEEQSSRRIFFFTMHACRALVLLLLAALAAASALPRTNSALQARSRAERRTWCLPVAAAAACDLGKGLVATQSRHLRRV